MTTILMWNITFLVRICETLALFLCSVSFYTATAIGIDRLHALQLHLRYEAEVTPFRVTVIITFIWVFSGLSAGTRLGISALFYHALSLIGFPLLVANFGVYLKIYLIIRRHQAQIAHHHQQQRQHQGHDGNIFRRLKKSVVNTFLVYIALVSCYLPFFLGIIFVFEFDSFTSSTLVANIS